MTQRPSLCKNTVLFVSSLETQFLVQQRVAGLLKSQNHLNAVFYFDHALPYRLQRMVVECERQNIPYYASTGDADKKASGLIRMLPGILSNFLYFWRFYSQQIHEARSIIQTTCPRLIILGEDGVGGNNAIAVVAHRLGITTLILPYEYSTHTQQLDAVRSNQDYLRSFGRRSLINVLVGYLYPHWVYSDNDLRLLRHPGPRVLVQELLGIAPRLPWTVHGGSADMLAAENPIMLHHYLHEGILESKIVLTGTVFDDVLTKTLNNHHTLKNELIARYHLPSNKPILLCALPTDFTYLPRSNFSSFHNLLKHWINAVIHQSVFSPLFHAHPSINESEKEFIRSLGVSLASENIATLIPLTDLFVTSISSTIRWAIACGTPVLNYDVYRWNFHDYVSAPGVITVDSYSAFKEHLERISNDKPYLKLLRHRQISVAKQWGMLDGKSGDRILNLMNHLVPTHG